MSDVVLWVGVALGTLMGLFLIILVAGSFMPRSHTVSRGVDLRQSQQAVWEAITDFANVANWHPEVVQVERLDDKNGHPVWKETYKGNYSIVLETTEEVKMKKLVRTIADVSGPFSGRWELEIEATETGSHLRITEYGEIPNPFFRFMARLFMNPALYMEMYLKALAKKFGEEPVLQEK
jgi:uncharacterized protein YndB with AHSA1/START domain